MAESEHTLKLKATLDTSEANAKLQKLQGEAVQQGGKQGGSSSSGGGQESVFTKQMSKEASLMVKAMATYVGGEIMKTQAANAQARGDTTQAAVYGGIGGAMQGAAAGAAFGPAGIAIGATLGGLNGALAELDKAADAAAEKIWEMQDAINKTHEAVITAEEEVTRAQTIRGLPEKSRSDLKQFIDQQKAVIARYEDLAVGQERENWKGTPKEFGEELENRRKAANEANVLLRAAESVLGKTPSMPSVLAPASGMAAKGYDVAGYGGFSSLDQQWIQKQTEVAQNTKQTYEAVKLLQNTALQMYGMMWRGQIRNINDLTSKWG